MKQLLLSIAAIILLILVACTKPQPRTIDNPSVAATNASNLDVTKVELNDSATTLYFHIKYRPGWWIRIAKEAHLVADGVDYAPIATDGIELGEHFTMPESGEADFTITFAPVPLATTTFDFTEGVDYGWTLYGIDATGTAKAAAGCPAGMPEDVYDIDLSTADAEPVLEVAPTELRVHMLGWRPEYGNKITLSYQNVVDDESEEVAVDANGLATVTRTLYGPTTVSVSAPNPQGIHGAGVIVAPGEATDIYVDPAVFSDFVAQIRDWRFETAPTYLYDNGRYAALNRSLAAIKAGAKDVSDGLARRMDAGAYVDALAQNYAAEQERVAALEVADAAKQLYLETLKLSILNAAANARGMLASSYYFEKGNDVGLQDSIKIALTPEHFARVAESFDGASSTLAMHPYVAYIFTSDARSGFNWADYGVVTGNAADLKEYALAYGRAKDAKLNDADMARLENLSNLFYAKAAKARQEQAIEDFAKMKEVTEELPQTTPDKLFDAIVERYKGKVVLVDLWNTWCSPCRNALKATEPLKDGELANDDIVWVYIADRSSNPNQYLKMLPNIRGHHYMVDPEQIAAIRKQFNVDGIPYYILVDRQGKATGHPDFRDHSRLEEGVKAAL